MSYNKNTINLSQLDTIVENWRSQGYPVEITTLGHVPALGLNDDYLGISYYPIRKAKNLTTGEIVIERMERSSDPDMDDHLVSYTFPSDIDNWKIEVYTDE